MVGAGSMDFGGSQTHEDIAQERDTLGTAFGSAETASRSSSTSDCSTTGAERMAPVVFTVFTTLSEQHVKSWRLQFEKLGQQINSMIEYITPRNNVHGDIKRKMSTMKTTYARLERLDADFIASQERAGKKCGEAQTSPELRQPRSVRHLQRGGKNNAESSKRKEISPLQAEAKRARKAKRRVETPRGLCENPATDTNDPPDAHVQQDQPWEGVETKKKKKKKKEKEGKERSAAAAEATETAKQTSTPKCFDSKAERRKVLRQNPDQGEERSNTPGSRARRGGRAQDFGRRHPVCPE